jgi:uncharacterized protein involved in outer membrane biogenesis
MAGRAKTWGIVALVVFVGLVVGVVAAFRAAVGVVRGKVEEALGPESTVKELRVSWNAVEVVGLRSKAPQGWPAADTLVAERIVIVPRLRTLFSDRVQAASVTIVKPYLSALRTRDGRLRFLPRLLEQPAQTTAAAPPARVVRIGRVRLEDGVVELYDATVAQPPLKIRLEQLQATLRDVLIPALDDKTPMDITGVLKGVRRDGTVALSGWAVPATRDSSIKAQLRSVDLVALQPYLHKASETRVQKGALDLDLQSEVRANRLRAPGKLVISDLEFAPASGAFDTFMGVPRGAVVSFLKSKDNKITVNFILEGDINNPRFALNEAFATRIASSMADSMGVSIKGLAEGVGGLVMKGGGAMGDAVKGLGKAVEGLFGGQRGR